MVRVLAFGGIALVVLAACGKHGSAPAGGDAAPDAPPSLACLFPDHALAGGDALTLELTGDGFLPGAVATWNGQPRPTRYIGPTRLDVDLAPDDLASPGQGQLAVANPPPGGTPAATATFRVVAPPATRLRLPARSIYLQFERRGYPTEYWMGQILEDWNTFDSVVGSTRADEAALQLDQLAAMGLNRFTYELRAADPSDGSFTPPACTIGPALGLQYPQPTATELANLVAFLDLAASKGFTIDLRLVNTHMEEQPPANNQVWLGSILGAIEGHPALDLVIFDGNVHLLEGASPAQCGIPAEAPLYLGPTSTGARYVKWAIGYAMSLGFPARQLSAEAIVGAWGLDQEAPAGGDATGQHQWPPVQVEKQLFDDLAIPPDQRTYALSMYEQDRCRSTLGVPCTDEPPDAWARDTLRSVWDTVGRCSGSRIVAPEMGNDEPVSPGWRSEWALENLTALFERYGVEGGGYWRWVNTMTSDDSDPTRSTPIKWRGTAFSYSVVQRELADLGGTHLGLVPNGSFERAAGGVPAGWTFAAVSTGSAASYDLTAEPGEPEVATRGTTALRLRSGDAPDGESHATSAAIAAAPSTAYVLAGTLRFAFSGDPDPTAAPEARPQVDVAVHYFQADGTPSAQRASDVVRYFEDSSTQGFATLPVAFTSPADCASVTIELAVARHGLPSELVADFDALR